LNHIRASDSDPRLGRDPAAVRNRSQADLHGRAARHVFRDDHASRTGRPVATEEQYRTMREAGALDDDVVRGAADAVLFERARILLLGGGIPL